MKRAIILTIFFLFLIIPVQVYSQEIKEIEFRNQLITDILLALAEMTGKSIIPDETVDGRASYFFSETDFETALGIFLQTYKLYYKKDNDVYYVSKIRVNYDTSSQLISLDAEDVDISYIIRTISRNIGKTILFDSLPSRPLTIHTKSVTPRKLMDIVMKRFPEYTLEVDKDFFYIKHIPQKPSVAEEKKPGPRGIIIEKNVDMYSIRVEKARFADVIDALFSKADYEYSLLMKRDMIVDNLRFNEKSFERLLRIILEQANADYKKAGEIYYIFEISAKDVLKKFKSTVKVPLVYTSVQEIPKLFPPELANSKLFKIDPNTNSIILSGSIEEIDPVQKFLLEIDRPKDRQKYYRFDLNYIDIKDVKSVIPGPFKHHELVNVPNTNSFVMLLSPEKKEIFDQYLKMIDTSVEVEYVKLKYIKAEYLKEHHPPSITPEDIIQTGDPSVIFIKGSSDKLDAFYRELELLDQPVPQIRYVILVVQYQEGESLNWNQNLTDNVMTVQSPAEDNGDAFLASLGKVFSLNLDIVSNFGYQFALQLNLDLSEDRAKVLADTTLNGISGEEINFQNTSTFRFREFETDPNTGELRQTGVVREIVSGLIINITGWVSGDGMITMDVGAEVSRLGTDVSAGTTREPTTFEKILKTHVRAQSGEPIVIGGLITEENGISVQKIPLLGDIPLLGYLFQTRKDTVDRSEFVIYIFPYAEFYGFEEENINRKIESLYYKFFSMNH